MLDLHRSVRVSAEWRHEELLRTNGAGTGLCIVDGEDWPCDAEKMRVERDAAIRRAADVSAALFTLVAAVEHPMTPTLMPAAIEQARAALRFQESQKPRRDVPSVNAHPHGEPTLMPEPPETEDR
jgi:hypothetical protein